MPREVVAADLVEAAGQVRAGVAHHDVDPAEGFDGIVDQRGDLAGLQMSAANPAPTA